MAIPIFDETISHDNAAYSAGEVLGAGTGYVWENACAPVSMRSVLLQSIYAKYAFATAGPDLLLYFFQAAVASRTDHQAFTMSAAEWANLVGELAIGTGDWVARDSKKTYSSDAIGKVLRWTSTGSYHVIVTAAGSFTPGASDKLDIILGGVAG